MNTQNPFEAANKAKALDALFPDRLPHDFAASFEPEDYGTPPPNSSVKSIIESKKELMRMLIDHREQKQEIIQMWMQLFPGDMWVNDLK